MSRPSTPFHKPVRYSKIDLGNGVTAEAWGEVEIVPGVIGPARMVLTGSMSALKKLHKKQGKIFPLDSSC